MDSYTDTEQKPHHVRPGKPVPPPDLRIVPVKNLIPHELHDRQRSDPLIQSLRASGLLKNPPVVTPLGNERDKFMVLDGANRALAFSEMGIPHILVQVVDYDGPHVELLTWHHVISKMEADEILSGLGAISRMEMAPADLTHARAELARRAILAYCLVADQRTFMLSGGVLDLRQRTQLLQEIVGTYIHKGRLDRTNSENLDELLKMYPAMTAAIIFPQYEPVEVIDIAQSRLKIPPGLTRHIIHGRALRLNYPLERLASGDSLEKKNQELAEWSRAGFEHRRVRFYAEATYLFDE